MLPTALPNLRRAHDLLATLEREGRLSNRQAAQGLAQIREWLRKLDKTP